MWPPGIPGPPLELFGAIGEGIPAQHPYLLLSPLPSRSRLAPCAALVSHHISGAPCLNRRADCQNHHRFMGRLLLQSGRKIVAMGKEPRDAQAKSSTAVRPTL
jgi:hypothetical protein